jgi:CHAT domain-containing protein
MSIIRISVLVTLAQFIPTPAVGQFFSMCDSGSSEDLQQSINGHNEHVERMNRKFKHYWYFQGTVDARQFELEFEEILQFLQSLDGRKAAVLFYAHRKDPSRLCTWLVSPHVPGGLVSHFAEVDIGRLTSITTTLFHSLGIGRRSTNRAPWRGTQLVSNNEDSAGHSMSASAALQNASDILLPQPIASAIASSVDTLIVVPMTVIYGTDVYGKDAESAMASESPTVSIGTLPLAAFPVGDRQLVDIASIVVSPGFAAFKFKPRRARRDFSSAVIVGDPSGETDSEWQFPELPGAAAEAYDIAAEVDTELLLTGAKVNVPDVEEAIQADPDLIHLATHGIASRENPLDGSFLWLNSRWSAREISEIRLDNHPLVVLSACQTGLGKDFAAGTTGLARAWIQSGASNVVMSLWNVDDSATRDLMVQFVQRSTRQPADRALQAAMLHTRSSNPEPYYWAGFTTFGAPELDQRID